METTINMLKEPRNRSKNQSKPEYPIVLDFSDNPTQESLLVAVLSEMVKTAIAHDGAGHPVSVVACVQDTTQSAS